MFMKDKNKSVSAIIARMKPTGDSMKNELPSEEKVQDESPEVSGVESAADEIMSAIESKDSKALAEALKSFLELADSESNVPEQE